MDAGIPMNFLPIATTCLVVKTNDPENNSEEIDLDPCADEETPNQKQPQYQGSVCVMVTTNNIQSANNSSATKVLNSISFGIMSPKSYLACIDAASRASMAVTAFMRLVIEQKCTRESMTLWNN